jgi:hypothetical protein
MELARIKIGDRVFPFRIDLTVLEQIEERFGTVEQFEQELVGWRFKRDEDGRFVRKGNGDIAITIVKPNIKALIFILPRMINRGIKLEALETGDKYEPVDPDILIGECGTDPAELRMVVVEELRRCFGVKKDMPGRKREKNYSR